jgi:hypothetical protein
MAHSATHPGGRQDRREAYQKLARLGFAARGVTYGLIGVLAVIAAFGSGGGTTGQTGALQTLADSTLGKILLFVVGIGLFGYGLWRLISALLDLENEGKDKKGLAKRAAHVGSGLFHFALAVYAIGLVFGAAGGGSRGADGWTATLMGAPFGIFLVGLAGVIGLAAAAAQAKKAIREEYKERLRPPPNKGWIDPTIKAGLLSRAVVFAIIGVFLIVAAIQADPSEARGVGGALDWLQGQAWGGVLLFLIGAGLMAFAFYSFLQARYRVVPDPEGSSRSKGAVAPA